MPPRVPMPAAGRAPVGAKLGRRWRGGRRGRSGRARPRPGKDVRDWRGIPCEDTGAARRHLDERLCPTWYEKLVVSGRGDPCEVTDAAGFRGDGSGA